jgi:hypothetical protein
MRLRSPPHQAGVFRNRLLVEPEADEPEDGEEDEP